MVIFQKWPVSFGAMPPRVRVLDWSKPRPVLPPVPGFALFLDGCRMSLRHSPHLSQLGSWFHVAKPHRQCPSWVSPVVIGAIQAKQVQVWLTWSCAWDSSVVATLLVVVCAFVCFCFSSNSRYLLFSKSHTLQSHNLEAVLPGTPYGMPRPPVGNSCLQSHKWDPVSPACTELGYQRLLETYFHNTTVFQGLQVFQVLDILLEK